MWRRIASGRRFEGQPSRAWAGRQHAGQAQALHPSVALAVRDADGQGLTCICPSVMPSQRCSASAHASAAGQRQPLQRQATRRQTGFSAMDWQARQHWQASMHCGEYPLGSCSLTSQRGGRNDEHRPLIPVSRHHSNRLHRLQQTSDGEANKQARRSIESQLQLRVGSGCQQLAAAAAGGRFSSGQGQGLPTQAAAACCTATATLQLLGGSTSIPCPAPFHLRSAPARRGAAQTARPLAGRASAAAQGWMGCGSSGCCRPGCARWPARNANKVMGAAEQAEHQGVFLGRDALMG